MLTFCSYWDWELSSNTYPDLREDPILFPELGKGFDGNGLITSDVCEQCLQDGPFKSLRPAWFQGRYSPKCLTRQFDPPREIDANSRWMRAQWYASDRMSDVPNSKSYSEFRSALETRGHAFVHVGIGGDMAPTDSSPNEPLFFLYHTNVDRYWWNW